MTDELNETTKEWVSSRKLYVEVIADGTVPERVNVTKQPPTLFWGDEDEPLKWTVAAEIDGGDREYRGWAVPWPLDDDGNLHDGELWLVVSWVDDDGYSVELYRSWARAVATLGSGWGSMSWALSLVSDDEVVAHGGSGVEFSEDDDELQHAATGDESAYVHLFRVTV